MTIIRIGLMFVLLSSAGAFGQRLEFEVASVKRNTANGPVDTSPRRSGDLIMMHNAQPTMLIIYAYRINASYQMEGYKPLPDGWNWFDIDVRTPAGATDDQVRLMFQSLLEDRFKLKVHWETRELPIFELVVGNGKSKLQASRDREAPMDLTIEGKAFIQSPDTCAVSLWREGSHLTCHAARIDQIAKSISGQLRAPVVERTGLNGTYDLNVRFIPEDRRLEADIEPAPTLQQALDDVLGLKLEKSKGPVEVLVIDHMEKPSEN